MCKIYKWRTQIYHKRDDVNFPIVNFPFICSNIPAAPAYGVYISQLIQFSRACGSYNDLLERGFLLTRMLLNQEFLVFKFKSSLRKYTISVINYHGSICSVCRNNNVVLSSSMTYHRVCNKSNTKGATYGARNAYPAGTTEFTLVLCGVSFARSLVLCIVFCRLLFVRLSFFACLSFGIVKLILE
jgi:hypothetical protein